MRKNKYKTDHVILKHDQLRELTKSLTSIDEQRLVNSCLTLVHQGKLLDEELCYNIDVANYADKSGISEAKAYSELKAMLDYHFKAAIDIPQEGTSVLRTHIILQFRYDDALHTLDVKFHKEVIPLLSGNMQKGTFHYFDTRMDTVPSNRRYLMGELLQRNMWRFKEGPFRLSIADIRKALNLTSTEYPDPSDIVRRIIQPTVQDIAGIMQEYINYKKVYGGFEFTKVRKEQFGKVVKQRVEPNNLHTRDTIQVGMIFSSLRQLLQASGGLEDDFTNYNKEALLKHLDKYYTWQYLVGNTGKVQVTTIKQTGE